jgi:hypothetical protein
MIGPAFCGAAGLLYTDTVTSKTGGKTVCSELTLLIDQSVKCSNVICLLS